MPRKIYISYRRDDSPANAQSINQYLEREFGRGIAFIDVDMPARVKFPEALERRLAECKVLLALIGPRWLDARDDAGNRRLDDPHDWVRLEIARALKREITVIPVLLEGAQLPKKSDLPLDIQGLVDCQAARVTSNGFRNEMAGLARDIRAITGSPNRVASFFGWVTAVVVATALVTAIAYFMMAPKTRTFTNPMYAGKRLDYCYVFSFQPTCGEEAAKHFCKEQNYQSVAPNGFEMDYGIGDTMTMGDNRLGGRDGFKFITCTDPVKEISSPSPQPPSR
jgi:hypothetical protein